LRKLRPRSASEISHEIEGDLLEQSRAHGRFWFWYQLKLISLVLAFDAFIKAPARILLYSYAIYELVLKLNWWLLIPLRAKARRYLDAGYCSIWGTTRISQYAAD